MNPIRYIKKNGIKQVWKVFYQYKADLIIQKAMKPFLKNKPLQDIIMIESHNDFDCNGGAFYDYLIQNGYNKKYKIVWLMKHPEVIPRDLPENVEWVPLHKPSFKKDYYIWIAKYFTADNTVTNKKRKEQKSFYLGHAAVHMKNANLAVPHTVDYVLIASGKVALFSALNYKMSYPNNKYVNLGFPVHDRLYAHSNQEIEKITKEKFDKCILWMPTFRKGGGNGNRSDSLKEQKLGIPLLETIKQYERLNDFLKNNKCFLIIKLHPMQDLSSLKIKSMSNIVVLTGKDVKNLHIDNYRLLLDVDALISDYSSIAFDFMHLSKPLGYVLDDIEEYVGFTMDQPLEWMPGNKIYSIEDMKKMIEGVTEGKDAYINDREKLSSDIFNYHDGNSCQRLVEFMGL